MKKTFTSALLLAIAVAGNTFAQSSHARDPHSSHTVAATHSVSGIVKKIDIAQGTVTFAHDPIPALNWPAMTMRFTVKEKFLFEKLNVGKKVIIEFQQEGADNVVTSVR